MPFQIIRNDITKVKADVIVNTANPNPLIGGGTDSAIYNAAGADLLLAERKRIGRIARGGAVVTPAFNLSAKYIIHTVGPTWVDGNRGERDILRSCYESSLTLANELGVQSIAFPLIATGVYGFPRTDALNIALSSIGKFLLTHDMSVILVVFDRRSLELSSELVGEIDEYIDEHGVGLAHDLEYGKDPRFRQRLEAEYQHKRSMNTPVEDELRNSATAFINLPDVVPLTTEQSKPLDKAYFTIMPDKTLDEVISDAGETFQQRLFKLIDDSGMDDVSVYKKANIDRKVFSRIRCKTDYKPKKTTAVAFALALQLDMPTMLDLLSRAEIAFSPSNKFDLIISYFITNKIYDVFQINAALFKYGQPTICTEE